MSTLPANHIPTPPKSSGPNLRFRVKTKPISNAKVVDPEEPKTFDVIAVNVVISNGHLWFYDRNGETIRLRCNGTWEDVWIVHGEEWRDYE